MLVTRRSVMIGGSALCLAPTLPHRVLAAGSMTAAIYPGTWDEAFRTEVQPRLLENHGIDIAFDPLWAVDQIAQARAARGVPPFDCFVLDPGPAAQGEEAEMFEPIDASRLENADKLPEGMITDYGVTVNAQMVGIVYNPSRLPEPPTRWEQLLEDPYVSELGLTGFQTTFGTVSLIELSKALGGSITNVEPVFERLREVLPRVGAVTGPGALPSLFQQGDIGLMYTNTQNVATLRGRGVDIAFQVPETGAITFRTTLHIAKDAENVEEAYRYIDTAISAEVQEALMQDPYNLLPVNRDVPLDEGLPIASLDELGEMVTHDWTEINPQRSEWIERFNREMTL